MTDAEETPPCEKCGSDGETLKRDGSNLCGDCLDVVVAFAAECDRLDCGWSARIVDTAFDRAAARQNIQMQANNHEKRKRIFDNDHGHHCDWERVDLTHEAVQQRLRDAGEALRVPSADGHHFIRWDDDRETLTAVYEGPHGPENRPGTIDRRNYRQLVRTARDWRFVALEDSAFADPAVAGHSGGRQEADR